jgi:hypothetical protein
MKKYKIAFWITTTAIFLFEGVLVAFTWNSEMSRQGIVGLGYPVYFIGMLALFKVFGTLALMIPKVPARVKEWAYAGFGIDFISAFVSIVAVGGFSVGAILPVVFMIILIISYVSRNKILAGAQIKQVS